MGVKNRKQKIRRGAGLGFLFFVENAIKYSTDFSNDLMIVVSAKVEGDNIKIEIQDNGEGIEENILKK